MCVNEEAGNTLLITCCCPSLKCRKAPCNNVCLCQVLSTLLIRLDQCSDSINDVMRLWTDYQIIGAILCILFLAQLPGTLWFNDLNIKLEYHAFDLKLYITTRIIPIIMALKLYPNELTQSSLFSINGTTGRKQKHAKQKGNKGEKKKKWPGKGVAGNRCLGVWVGRAPYSSEWAWKIRSQPTINFFYVQDQCIF